ncbi:MAG TPA: FG-GAP-like repeat-containing protein [Pyrinomonadaceae bacterium]
MQSNIVFLIILSFTSIFVPNDEISTHQYDSQIVNTYVVTNTTSIGPGSLRQAIIDANLSPGTDLVTFNIGGGGPQTIPLEISVPQITDPIIIDGSTQPGFEGVPLIEITVYPGDTLLTGFKISAGNSTIKYLAINRFSSSRITLTGQGGNTIFGNYIGLDLTGTVGRGGGSSGISVEGSTGNTLERNVISAASNGVIFLNANNNVVIGNYFGTDRTGSVAISNGTGVNISSGNNNQIGGTTEGSRNVISGNVNSGVFVAGGQGHVVQGNYIGINASGTGALGNSTGVTVWGGSNTLVGGSAPGAKNVISGNINAVKIWGPETGNKLQGNYIGTDYLGLNPIPNTGDAITLTNPTDIIIGGEAAGEGNLVSGNGGRCVWVWSGSSTSPYQAKIQGNFFGVKSDGIGPLGNGTANGADCIMFSNLAQNALISGNIIANNGGKGVYLNGSDEIKQVTMRRNRFFDNAGLGISFRTSGVSPNDFCDNDSGWPNGSQNYPVIASAKIQGNTLQTEIVMWDVFTAANFEVDVFASESCDVSGYGEGKYFLGSFAYTSDATCQTRRTVSLPVPSASAKYITATLTDSSGNTSEFSPCFAARSVTSVFDFDGDSKTDISVYRPSNGEWWLNRSSNSETYAAQFGALSDKIAPADYTGDGKTDIAVWRPNTGEWFILRSENSSYYSFSFGAAGDIPAPGDFDADGKADAAVFRPSSATWYVMKSTGGTLIQQFGQKGDAPVVADYDGDGKADIAIYRPPLGEWWINRSTAGLIAYQFGAVGDKLVWGDYTGDGKADAAVWRPSNGSWYILRSEDQSYYSFPFGTNGDIPAPGDYDGDAKFDAAVFRPSNATWYVNKSSGGTLIQTFGQNGDTPAPAAFVP